MTPNRLTELDLLTSLIITNFSEVVLGRWVIFFFEGIYSNFCLLPFNKHVQLKNYFCPKSRL